MTENTTTTTTTAPAAEAPAKAPTKAQAALLVTLAKASKKAPAPVGANYSRTAKALVTNGWAAQVGDGYELTDTGKALAAELAKAARAAAKAQANGEGTTTKAKAPAKAAEPKAKTPAKGAVLEVGGVAHPGLRWQSMMDAKGWLHMEAATRMGVAPMTVGRIARCQGVPTASLTVKFAKALDADARTLWADVAAFELAAALAEAK